MFKFWYLVLTLLMGTKFCHGQWTCGSVRTESNDNVCFCNNTKITYKDRWDNLVQCCGLDTCYSTPEGNIQCPDGKICYGYSTYPCGDIRVPSDSTRRDYRLDRKGCSCGKHTITPYDWKIDRKWCCPASKGQCYYKINGYAHCDIASVKVGKNDKCDSVDQGGIVAENWFCGDSDLNFDSVCICEEQHLTFYEDYYKKEKWCCPSSVGHCSKLLNGDVMCEGSTVKIGKYEQCDNDISYDFCNMNGLTKCPVRNLSMVSANQECYQISTSSENEYDCITRGDQVKIASSEPDADDVVNYESIKVCTTDHGRRRRNNNDGLMCGKDCLDKTKWCIDDTDTVQICTVDDLSFSTNNPELCGNSSFWREKDCNIYYDGILTAIGKRCSAGQQHCSYPTYSKVDIADKSLVDNCTDKSDDVHQMNITCDTEAASSLDKYCQTFCSSTAQTLTRNTYFRYFINDQKMKIMKGKDCKRKCLNVKEWISGQSDPALTDPGNCQQSCLNKSPNCEACTHPDYKFHCKINGIDQCYHRKLRCDLHPLCDNAEDEIGEDCRTKQGRLKPQATTICKSRKYPESRMDIYAIACDGNTECSNDEDEGWLCHSNLSLYGTLVAITVILMISLMYKYHQGGYIRKVIKRGTVIQEEEETEHLKLPEVLNKKIFMENHDLKEFKDDLNLYIEKCKVCDKKKLRIQKNQRLFQLELSFHGGNKAETYLCIKNNIELSNSKVLIEDAFPGFLRRNFPKIEDLLDWLEANSLIYWLLNKVKNIANIYLDICKDTFFLVTVIAIVGGLSSVVDFPTSLSTMIIFGMFGSIVIPLVISSIISTIHDLKKTELSFWEKVRIYVLNVILSPLKPMTLTQEYEDNKSLRRSLILYEKNRDKVLKLYKEAEKKREDFGRFIRIDLGLEVFYQLGAQIVLLLFSWTNSKTTGGLEEMNKKSSPEVLIFSILLSWKSITFTSFKTIRVHKPFLPMATSYLVFPWIIVSASIRVLVFVLYFTPGFGLFSILNHWKFEQTPYSEELNTKLMRTNKVLLRNNATVPWTDLNRWNYSDQLYPTPPPYTLYTEYSLAEYSIWFWVILGVHTYVNVLIKIATSEHFRKNCSTLIEMTVHGLENTNIPIVWRDWDVDTGNIKDHKKRSGNVLMEMILIMIAKAVAHATMLLPIIWTADKINERHAILSQSIGFFQDELDSVNNINILYVVSVVVVPVLTLIELTLYIIYQRKMHTWVDILTDHDENEVNEDIDDDFAVRLDTDTPEGSNCCCHWFCCLIPSWCCSRYYCHRSRIYGCCCCERNDNLDEESYETGELSPPNNYNK